MSWGGNFTHQKFYTDNLGIQKAETVKYKYQKLPNWQKAISKEQEVPTLSLKMNFPQTNLTHLLTLNYTKKLKDSISVEFCSYHYQN